MTAGEIWIGLSTIIAVVVGPVLAVAVTRYLDDKRADKARKYDIYRTLMRTRKLPIHADHVAALNLIEVEFIRYPKVLATWKDYIANLGEDPPPIEQKDQYDAAFKRRDSLLARLISEVALALKIPVQQLDILAGNYVPKGWYDDEWEARFVRRSLLNVLSSRAPIVVHLQQPQGPYPPAPLGSGGKSPSGND